MFNFGFYDNNGVAFFPFTAFGKQDTSLAEGRAYFFARYAEQEVQLTPEAYARRCTRAWAWLAERGRV